MLSILASFAQEESLSVSENIKWGIRRNFQKGIPNSFCIYGYRYIDGICEVVPEEAAVIRRIYTNYLNGISAEETARQLNSEGIKSYTGIDFPPSAVRAILKNVRYTGVLHLQKTFIENHLTHKTKSNNGELPMYIVENAHPAIIDTAMFEAVQAERLRRRELGVFANKSITTSVFTSKIKCGICGASFHRKSRKRANGAVWKYWRCATQDKNSQCGMKDIPEDKIMQAVSEIFGEFDEDRFAENVTLITVPKNFVLVFHLADGTQINKTWGGTSRTDCWTSEARQAASERMKNRADSAEECKARSDRMKALWAERKSQNKEHDNEQ